MDNKSPKLYRLGLFFFILVVIKFMTSCSHSTSKQPANADGFKAIEVELKDKFGDNAYYTDLYISHDTSIGNMINLTVTDAPESLKMGTYVFSQHTSWKQDSEVTIEVPEGTKAADYMFQLNDKINLETLGDLVQQSRQKLTEDKSIDNPAFKMAMVKFPKNGDIKRAEYVVKLEPEHGGTSFNFYYTLNGDLINMNY